MYSNRRELSEENKIKVKNLYTNIINTKEESGKKAIIDNINDIQILKWLNDLFVKKITIAKEGWKTKEVEESQKIAQMIINRRNEILIEGGETIV